MYILKDKKNRFFYKDMIAGMMVNVSSDESDAQRFESREKAELEKATHEIYLATFEIVEVQS